MLEEKNTFEIEALQVNTAEGTTFEIKDFDSVKETAVAICDSFITSIIQDDEANKKAKDFRAKCNKAKKQIKDLRLSTEKAVLGTFEEQAKELEAIFDKKQKEIGEVVNAYTDSKKAEKTLVNNSKVYQLKLSYTNPNLTDLIVKFCQDNNITVEEI